MRRLYLADLHLEDPQGPHFRAFAGLLDAAADRLDEVYLLGDLCEVWVGDDDDGPLASALTRSLAAAASRCRVRLMHGNRDFLFGERLASGTGVELITDPHVLEADTLLAHGDAFCIDDQAYQALRATLRSPAWQQDVLGRPLADRRALAASMRAQSRDSNANKAANIMDVNAGEVARVMALHGARRLIHGHTHRPGRHVEPWGERWVLGAWERCGWALLEDDRSALHLRCFPLEGDPSAVLG
ncbi:MAG: UDP-2,3-diacylglucosamine diphosphatase [Pseudomonadales bacterium]